MVGVVTVVTLLSIVSPSTFVVLLVGLLPSLVAWVVDRTESRSAAVSVGSLNAAGVTPFIFDLLFEASGMTGAVAIITNPFALVAMYGAAATGWLLFSGIPVIAEGLDAIGVDRRVRRLRDRQRALLEEWGADVVGAPEAKEEPSDAGRSG